MLSALYRTIRRLLHPYDHPSVLQGHPLSELDATAERLGIGLVDTFFDNEGHYLAVSFAKYLGGDINEGIRALKKDFHMVMEQRLRAVALRLDSPSIHGLGSVPLGTLGHPLDGFALGALMGCSDLTGTSLGLFKLKRVSRFRHWVSLISWAVSFNLTSIFILLRYGRLSVNKILARVATPDFGEADLWESVCRSWSKVDQFHVDKMVMVSEEKRLTTGIPFKLVNPNTFHVPIVGWTKDVIIPGMLLCLRVLVFSWKNRSCSKCVEAAVRTLNMAGTSISVWRIAFNISARWYLDLMDSSSKHNLKAVIFRRFKMGLVRWPYAQIESPGSALSYLGYDLFLSAGPYQKKTYGVSWNPKLTSVSVGQLRNDRNIIYGRRLKREYADEISSRITAGKRMALLLPGNDSPGLQHAGERLLRMVLPLFSDRKDWFVVIKPKKIEKTHGVMSKIKSDPDLSTILINKDVVVLPCDELHQEVCPTGWLLLYTSLGATLPGSVQFEGLALGVPLVGFFPINQNTPARVLLKECGLLYSTENDFLNRFKMGLNSTSKIQYQLSKIRENFDPYADHDAIARVGHQLFKS